MATTPTPAPIAPATPASISATLSPTRRRTARIAPPARMVYTRHATAGDDDDRIISHVLNVFYKIMAWGGGIAILIWILFGGIQWGRATASTGSTVAPEQVIYVPAPVPAVQPVLAQPPAPHWSSREECERYYALTLHEAPASRCQ